MKPVLVTTEHRGVFFGYVESMDGTTVTLVKAKCAIRWSTKGGFLELASVGPNANSKVGSEAQKIVLFDVTSIADVSEKAEKAWVNA